MLVFLGDDNQTIQEIDDIWLEEFRAYLLEVDKRSGKPRLSSSTALSYFNRVRTALTTAYKRRIIERNPANPARPIRAENNMREFLTLNEVKRLVETKCDQPVSCFISTFLIPNTNHVLIRHLTACNTFWLE